MILVCAVGFLWILNTVLQVVTLLVESGRVGSSLSAGGGWGGAASAAGACRHCCRSDYFDNLVERSFEDRMCLPPVDVVYTWVNGSDPRLREALYFYRYLEEVEEYRVAKREYDAKVRLWNATRVNRTRKMERVMRERLQRSNVTQEQGEEAAEAIQTPETAFEDPTIFLMMSYGNASVNGSVPVNRSVEAVPAEPPRPLTVEEQMLEAVGPPPVVPTQQHVHKAGKGSANRYRDNQELRYSLRSIWKFAPWVRHVYLVTNGQVPHWLNVDHPRLTVVPHDEIFANESHLPVFASPAIEANLHRIPGLADKFIYFNDDVMLGNTIWPDDFYTHSNGQKVFLSWDVPNCSPGCPETWISDGYCDSACNTPECGYDGGDCTGGGGGGGSAYNRYNNWATSRSPWGTGGLNRKTYCAVGCPNNWVGDKVCDRACKNPECGFDGGDCGLEIMMHEPSILGFDLQQLDGQVLELRNNTRAMYVNLTNFFPDAVTAASHDNRLFVRTAIITQSIHALSVLLYLPSDLLGEDNAREQYRPTVNIWVSGPLNSSSSETITASFNITMPVAPKWPEPPREESAEAEGSAAASNRSSVASVEVQELTMAENPAFQRLLRELEEGDEDRQLHGLPPAALTAELTEAIRRRFELTNPEAVANGEESPQLRARPEDGDEDGAFAESQVDVDGVPDSLDMASAGVTMRRLMSMDDEVLADVITAHKRKELDEIRREMRRSTVERVIQDRKDELERQGKPPVVWPWEVKQLLLEAAEQGKMAVLAEVNERFGVHSPTARRLLDTFGDSLRFVNALFTEYFGREARKVPAHMPHFIDKNIEAELQRRWPKQFADTSSHRFRHPQDMQFSFSYFYFMMNARQEFVLEDDVRTLDIREDGVIDSDELRLFWLYLHGHNSKPSVADLSGFKRTLQNCTLMHLRSKVLRHEPLPEHVTLESLNSWDSVPITLGGVAECPSVVEQMERLRTSRRKYKHEIVGLEEVEFYMMGDNHTHVGARLAEIRAKQPKFICLNDDMNKTRDPDPRTLKVLRNFFESFYPHPSPFELEPEQYHPVGYLDEILELRGRSVHHTQLQVGFVVAVAALAVFLCFGRCAGIVPRCCRGKRALRRGVALSPHLVTV